MATVGGEQDRDIRTPPTKGRDAEILGWTKLCFTKSISQVLTGKVSLDGTRIKIWGRRRARKNRYDRPEKGNKKTEGAYARFKN